MIQMITDLRKIDRMYYWDIGGEAEGVFHL